MVVGLTAAAWLTLSCHSASRSSARSSTETPVGTVTAFYEAIGRHDTTTAAGLLAPEVRQFYESSPDSDFTNVTKLTDIRDVKESEVPAGGGIPPGYQDVTQVALEYDVVYKRIVTEQSGTSTRFLYVGRTSSSGPWRILTIGSGP